MPLTGTRVLDFTRHLPGPCTTDLLRRLGAEIIKIEPPDGDPVRWLPPYEEGSGALFNLMNAGKASVVVDLKSDVGREFVQRLAAKSDVVVESYKPGDASKFGISYEQLREMNPKLVYCSISGYGPDNPRSSHDLNFVALAGMLDLQRDREGRPILPSTQIGDMSGALFAALAIVAALFEKQKTGEGKAITVSMADATRAVMPTAEALYRGTHHTPESFFLTGALPTYNVYETSDGKYIAIAPLEPQFWERFCRTIGRPDLIAHHIDDSRREYVKEAIAGEIKTKSRSEWEEIFAAVDACVEPVLSIEEAHERFGDPLQHHPLQVVFPREQASVGRLGDSFDKAASIAGYSSEEARKLHKTGRFQEHEKLRHFLMKAAAKRRQSR